MRLLFFIFFISLNLGAAVWKDDQQWSLQYEDEYSRWISSTSVNEFMFVDPASPYYGINADCADSAYALRAIFSYEHKLPFAIHNSFIKSNAIDTISNHQDIWDNVASGKKRVIAMINAIGLYSGTEQLAELDTYPVAIKSVGPGSLFMTQTSVGLYRNVQHTYNIKKVNPNGTFDVLYSSENVEANKTPMIRRKEKEFDILPVFPFGFRRFRWPEHLGVSVKEMPPGLNASSEQYTLAKKLGNENFFKFIKHTLATVEETNEEGLRRAFLSICLEANERITVVNQAQVRLAEIKNTCMDFMDFDIYSTPARDRSLSEAFFKLLKVYSDLKKNGNLKGVSPQLVKFTEDIFKNGEANNPELLKACPLNYSAGVVIDLSELWRRIYAEKLSSYPNDLVALRWGEILSPHSKCKVWY